MSVRLREKSHKQRDEIQNRERDGEKERERERGRERENAKNWAEKFTNSVPHNNVDVFAEGSVGMLGGIQVEEVTVMMIEVDSYF